jgi:hypothetical protein
MSDEPEGAGSEAGSPSGVSGAERKMIAKVSDAQRKMADLLEGQGNELAYAIVPVDPESLAIAIATAVYTRAFLEALGKRSGDGVADLTKRISIRVKARKGKRDELHVGMEGTEVATIVVTKVLPDEAWLALLDLDVTAKEVKGKTLRWDVTAGAWLPDDASLP